MVCHFAKQLLGNKIAAAFFLYFFASLFCFVYQFEVERNFDLVLSLIQNFRFNVEDQAQDCKFFLVQILGFNKISAQVQRVQGFT